MSREDHIRNVHRARKDATRHHANRIINRMRQNKVPVTFASVARQSGLAVGTLYRHPEIKARIVEEREAHRRDSALRASLCRLGTREEMQLEIARLESELVKLQGEMDHLYEIHLEPCWEFADSG